MVQIGQEFHFSEDLRNSLSIKYIYFHSHLIRFMLRHIGRVDLLDDELLPRVARLHQENPPEGPLANLPDDRVLFLHCDPVRQ